MAMTNVWRRTRAHARALFAALLGVGVLGAAGALGALGATPAGAATAPHATPPAPHVVPTAPSAGTNSPNVGKAAPAVSATPDIAPLTTPGAGGKVFTVNTVTDGSLKTSTSTTCVDTSTQCSLRAAIDAANNDVMHTDLVTVPMAGTYYLTTTLGTIDVTNNVHIVGAGSSSVIVDAKHSVELLDVYSTKVGIPAVLISGVTLQDGSSSSGADLYAEGDVTLQGVTLSGGAASSDGGDVYVTSDGALWTDAATVIEGGSAEYGGGIYADGPTDIEGSTLRTNAASSDGGAIYADTALRSENAAFTGNGSPDGGAVYNDYSFSDTGSTYTGNTASASTDGYGAVLYNDDAASLTDVTISTSSSDASSEVEGGVIYNEYALTLSSVSISGTTNRCSDCDVYGGVLYSESEASIHAAGLVITGTANGAAGGTAYISGGVLYIGDYGSLTMPGATISSTTNMTNDDVEGGVLYGTEYSNVSMSASTVTGTVDEPSSAGGDVYVEGGVLYLYYGGDELTGVTLFTTKVTTDDDEVEGGAVFIEKGTLKNLTIATTTVTVAGDTVYGAALYTETPVTVSQVSITGTGVHDVGSGRGEVEGGAWYNDGALTATGSQVLGTTVTADDSVYGGAFDNESDAATISESTFAGVTVTMVGTGDAYGGLAYFDDPASLTNVTMDDTTTTVGTGAAASVLYFDDSVQFTNDTIAHDVVAARAGSLDTSTSGGLVVGDDYTESFKNTIVATTAGAKNCNLNGEAATFASAGGNVDIAKSCGFHDPTDQSTATPKVATVAANGGPVETAALLPGSPALGGGVSAGAPSTDARGVHRPSGNIDAGAYQVSTTGYYEVASDGGIFAFTAPFYGSMGGKALNAPIVGVATTPTGGGYYEVASDGGIFAFGTAPFYGSMGGQPLNAPIVGMAVAPTGNGYYEVASDGGIFAFSATPVNPAAAFYGSMGGQPLAKPIVGMAVAPSGKGYYEVASDGGIFAFNATPVNPAAPFHGSMGGKPLAKPIVAMAVAPSGNGYYEVASDGGIFAFTAPFHGSMGGKPLAKPIVGIAATPTGAGYYEVASDGGIFAFGTTVPFFGSMGGQPLAKPIVGMAI